MINPHEFASAIGNADESKLCVVWLCSEFRHKPERQALSQFRLDRACCGTDVTIKMSQLRCR